jgi:hypothetical protein
MEQLKGKLNELFGLPHKILPLLLNDLEKFNSSSYNKFVRIDEIHRIVLKYFINNYFPATSKHINTNQKTMSVIMGGIAFNMNVPSNISTYKMPTNDIDVKVYTTEISHNEKNKNKISGVISIFQFTVLNICMYVKQILELIISISINYNGNNSILNSNTYNTSSKKLKQTGGYKTKKHKHINKKHSNKNKKNKKTKHNNPINKYKHQNQLKNKKIQFNKKIPKIQFNKGYLKDYKLFLQIKNKNANNLNFIEKELDLSKMKYDDIYNQILEDVNNIDYIITIRIEYNMNYDNLKMHINPKFKTRQITFSDCMIIYSSITSPGFYSYYFFNHSKMIKKSLEQLDKMNIPINDIINVNNCGNNCKYTSIDSLIIDTVLMLSFANYLEYENLESDNPSDYKILISIAYLFKYWKYLIKFLRLIVIKKILSKTLTPQFESQYKHLETYINKNLTGKTNSKLPETDNVNISFKRIINNFHQDFFINRSLLQKDYSELKEIADEFEKLAYYVNCSRALFKELDDSNNNKDKTIDSITIQFASKELSKSSYSQD